MALYVATIVVPTLVLLVLGMRAVRSQRDAIANLSAANRRLEEARVADAVEQAVRAEAEACLFDPAIGQVDIDADWALPETAARAGRLLKQVSGRHRLVKELFVVEGGTVRLPRVDSAPYQPTDQYLAAAHEAGLTEEFLRAEALERPGRYAEAAAEYRRLGTVAASPAARALALARLASCEEHAGDRVSSVAAWRQLCGRFPDVYTQAGRPAALVAAAEIARLEPGPRRPGLLASAEIASIRRALLDGRWEITADEADYFLSALGGHPSQKEAGAGYLEHLQVGRMLAAQFEPRNPLEPRRLYQVTLPGAGSPQVYYTAFRGSDGHTVVLGLVVDAGRIERAIIRDVAARLSLDTLPRLVPKGSGGTGFRQALGGWEVSLQSPAPAIGGQTLVFGATVAFVLGVLVLGVVLLMRDVARESATARLQADMVGGVSHELKTPLTVIRMYAETLASRPGTPEGERRSFADVIVQESDRLTHLINGVLEFTRLDRGARTYDFRRQPIASLVSRVVEGYRPYLEQRGFVLETEYDSMGDAATEVRADADAVTQAIVNLLDNAAKYSGDERRIAVHVRAGAKEAFVEIEDHGEGIARDDVERIFRKYYRGPTRSGRGGHGLGLFVVRQLMEAHGGRVEVVSEPGRGSRFRLAFPVVGPEPASTE